MRKAHRLLAATVLVAAALGGGLAGYAIAAQPHMNRALQDLRSAEGELQAAASNKGGHRERAMEFVRSAIGEVQAGVAAGS